MHEVVVIGGGPAGLAAAIFCRMRRLSVRVVDAGRAGGQLVSLYGDKPVHDWPGEKAILARDLAARLVDHARALGAEIVEQRKVVDVAAGDEGFTITARDSLGGASERLRAASVIVAIGAGAFEPRRLKLAGEDRLGEDMLTYRMPAAERVAGRRVVVVGGGDSGLESAQAAHAAGAQVTMIQVLDRFTGMEANSEAVERLGIARHFKTRVQALELDDRRLTGVVARTRGAEEPLRLPCDYLVVNIGAAVNLDAVRRWGIATEDGRIRVDGDMRTSVPGLLACGDIVTFAGKYKLLLTAAAEGSIAANSAYVHVRQPARLTMGELYT